VTKPQIFLDCDGVLADFDKRAQQIIGHPRSVFDQWSDKDFWDALFSQGRKGIYENLDKMPDADQLVSGVVDLTWKHGLAMPIILTGKPRGEGFTEEKLAWRDKNYPDLEMIVCFSAEKFSHMKPGDIIIDDWVRFQHMWENAGGRWILHKNAEQSLAELQEMLDNG
jgi:hypothetical protein